MGNETLDSNAAYSAMLLIEAASSKWFGDEIKIGGEEKIRIWFEHIAAASIKQLVKGTTVRFGSPFPKGWPSGFPNRVEKMASEFGITHRAAEIDAYASTNQQDDSLDIVSRWRLVDEEPSSPYLLVQCATGANWKAAKVAEPNMDLWRRYISWNGPIYKALAIPFALRGPGELKQISIRHHDTIVFDRIRLAAGRPDQLIEASLRRHLVRWCREKFNLLTNPGKRSTSEETPSEAITKRPPHPRRTKVFRRSKT